MQIYGKVSMPIPEAVAAAHAADVESFARPGTWLSAEERTAVVQHARDTRSAAGLQPPAAGPVSPAEVLPAALLELVEQVAVRPKTLTRAALDAALAAGVSDAEYVEVIALVSLIVNIDVFARSLGLPLAALGAPQDGEPSCERPATAKPEGAWVPTIPCLAAGGEPGRALYGGGMQPFIYRALSLVPADCAQVMRGGDAQYLTLDKFSDFTYSAQPGLNRAQVEVVAGRVSAYNDCFY